MTIGKKIARGREAEIFEWLPGDGDDVPKVLKLFFADRSIGHVSNELAVSTAIKVAGVPTPAVFGDVVEIDGRLGIVYERVYGTDMLVTVSSQPWRVRSLGRELGLLHAQVHAATSTEFAGLSRLKERLERRVGELNDLTSDEKQGVLNLLANLPDGDRVYHGDFHPGNVIVRTDGQPVIIDWANAALSDTMADVARSQLLISVGWRGAPNRTARFLGRWLSSWFLGGYLKAYFAETGADRASLDKWLIVMAAARLSENITAESKHLEMMVRSGLSRA